MQTKQDRVQTRQNRVATAITQVAMTHTQVAMIVSRSPMHDNGLHEALRGGRFVLVGTDTPSVDLPAQVDAAVPARPTGELLLVRPDCYLAWVGTAADFPAWASQYFPRPYRPVGTNRKPE